MSQRISRHRLQVASELDRFLGEEALPGTGLEVDAFWAGVDALIHELAPRNRELLAERERLQGELDTWHREHPGPVRDLAGYRTFLKKIDYLVDAPHRVEATTAMLTSRVPTMAASRIPNPRSRALAMDSSTTIESSTTRPVASARPPSDITLRLRPN